MISASFEFRNSSTSSSTSVPVPRVSASLPELLPFRLSKLSRDKPSMLPHENPSPLSLLAYPGHVSKMNFGHHTLGVDDSPSRAPSSTLPSALGRADGPSPSPRFFVAICFRDSAHRRTALTNVLLFSATMMSYGADFASHPAPASSAATMSSPLSAVVTETPHRSIAVVRVWRIILLSSYSKIRNSRPLHIEANVIVDGVRAMLTLRQLVGSSYRDAIASAICASRWWWHRWRAPRAGQR